MKTQFYEIFQSKLNMQINYYFINWLLNALNTAQPFKHSSLFKMHEMCFQNINYKTNWRI